LCFTAYVVFAAAIVFASSDNPIGFIDSPDECLSVSKVTPSDIYLTSTGVCKHIPGRAYVELKPGVTRKVFVDGNLFGTQVVHPLAIVDAAAILEKAEKAGAEMKATENKYAKPMQEAAQSTSDFYYSKGFQDTLQAQTEVIKDRLSIGQADTYYKDYAVVKPTGITRMGADERLYVFISSSVPTSVLRTYASDIAKLKDPNVVMVVRGFIGGMSKIGPTISFFSDVLKKDANCEVGPDAQCDMQQVSLIVDPLLFRKYQVAQVPSFVYVRGLLLDNPGMSEGVENHILSQGDTYMLSGDASLAYIVSKFADKSNSKALEEAGRVLR